MASSPMIGCNDRPDRRLQTDRRQKNHIYLQPGAIHRRNVTGGMGIPAFEGVC